MKESSKLRQAVIELEQGKCKLDDKLEKAIRVVLTEFLEEHQFLPYDIGITITQLKQLGRFEPVEFLLHVKSYLPSSL